MNHHVCSTLLTFQWLVLCCNNNLSLLLDEINPMFFVINNRSLFATIKPPCFIFYCVYICIIIGVFVTDIWSVLELGNHLNPRCFMGLIINLCRLMIHERLFMCAGLLHVEIQCTDHLHNRNLFSHIWDL